MPESSSKVHYVIDAAVAGRPCGQPTHQIDFVAFLVLDALLAEKRLQFLCLFAFRQPIVVDIISPLDEKELFA